MAKIRSDFVTNSSSSSYIIDRNKYDGDLSVEGVFKKIKELHAEYRAKLPAIAKYVKGRGVSFSHGNFYKNGKLIRAIELPDELRKAIEKEFDVYVDWLMQDGTSLDEYATYSAYAADGHCSDIGFSIVDYRDENLEFNYDACEIFYWYIEGALDYCCFLQTTEPPDCADCDENPANADDETRWSACTALPLIASKRQEYGDETMGVQEIARREILTLGEICVHSWDGQIEFNVARLLEKLCSYYCGHMG
jgi:hypothetical protein